MKIGIVPKVSVTKLDESRIRPIPDTMITSPVWSLGHFRPIKNPNIQITATIRGYKSSILRDMVPPAFPCRSKCAGRSTGKEFHRTIMAKAFSATIRIGINQLRLFISSILKNIFLLLLRTKRDCYKDMDEISYLVHPQPKICSAERKTSVDTGITLLPNLKVRLNMIDIAKKYVNLQSIY